MTSEATDRPISGPLDGQAAFLGVDGTDRRGKASAAKKRGLVYGSVCSGIEAATQAWHPLGWRPSFFSEIEDFPRAVLQHHYPEVPLHGDFTTIKAGDYEPIDLLVGGTPCQSFSIAGLRGGLGDDRGNLALEYLRLADRLRPKWVVWENVFGVLSSNGGRDFGSILGCMVELGYGVAYRVLDAQYVRTLSHPWAVPQRRRRVFLVGYLGDWRRAAAVLFDRESLSGNPPPRREAGKGFAADVAPSLVSSGRGVERTGETRGQDPVIAVANSGDVGYCLAASAQQSLDAETETETLIAQPVAHALRGEGFDASEDGTGRGTPLIAFNPRQDPDAETEVSPTLRAFTTSHANAGVPPAIAIQERAVCENPDAGPDGAGVRADGAAYTLEARTQAQAVAFDMRGREGGAMPEGPHDTANSRAASGGSSRSYVAQAFGIRSDATREGSAKTPSADAEGRVRLRDPGLGISEEVAPTVDAGRPHITAFAQNQRDELRTMDVAGALAAEPGMKQQTYLAVSKGNETLHTDGDRQEVEHAGTSEAYPGALLRGVREALGAEAFTQWGLGILDSLQPQEILRKALHGSELRPAAFSRYWVVHCALSRPEDRGVGAVQSMREAQGAGRASPGWEPSEQRAIELGAYLSGLPQPGPQAERFMFDLWCAAEGIGVLRQALSAVQAARRPPRGEGEPAHTDWAVRRLTVPECEFLQGFPRNFTNIPWRGKNGAPDGRRYKALGNSMAVNVMRLIGDRIALVEDLQ